MHVAAARPVVSGGQRPSLARGKRAISDERDAHLLSSQQRKRGTQQRMVSIGRGVVTASAITTVTLRRLMEPAVDASALTAASRDRVRCGNSRSPRVGLNSMRLSSVDDLKVGQNAAQNGDTGSAPLDQAGRASNADRAIYVESSSGSCSQGRRVSSAADASASAAWMSGATVLDRGSRKVDRDEWSAASWPRSIPLLPAAPDRGLVRRATVLRHPRCLRAR